MRVLICGANGFLGRHLGRQLLGSGHRVVALVRRPEHLEFADVVLVGDMNRDTSVDAWLPRLEGIDAVVNAVGILRERPGQGFERLHVQGPRALFEACVLAGVRRVVQISALGADGGAASGYHVSKRAADEHLLSLPLSATVVQPSLVFGPGGASARLFTAWASLPWVPLPAEGRQVVQPVHVGDVAQAIQALLEAGDIAGARVALVGPRAVTLREFLGCLRAGMGLGDARWIDIPWSLVRAAVALASRSPSALVDAEALAMLERGNSAPAEPIQHLLGRPPRQPEAFIPPEEGEKERMHARLSWLLPILRLSIAMVWIVTGLLSFGIYPIADSLALLGRLGITGAAALIALYGAATMDLALGIGTLVSRGRRWVWWCQLALMAGYMVLISWALPEFWLHPFGPILKNLPMLAAVGLLLALEKPRWNT